jgi:hypothetical protein
MAVRGTVTRLLAQLSGSLEFMARWRTGLIEMRQAV